MSDINLIPPQRLARKQRKARLRFWATVVGVYVLLLAAVLTPLRVLAGDSTSSVERELQSTQQSIQQCQSAIAGLHKQLAEVSRELQLSQAIRSQVDWSKLLVLLADELGDEIVLNNCRIITLNTSREEVTDKLPEWLGSSPLGTLLGERRYKLRLAGFGRTQNSVSQFVLRVEKTGIFDLVRLASSNRSSGDTQSLQGQAIAFTMECSL